MPNVKVMHFGLGPIGVAIVRQVAARPGFKIVGGIDIDPAKAGRDLGDVAGLPDRIGLKVSSMREAVLTILVADLVMSTDNVLGVAAASHNNYVLLIFGLVVSMAIILWMGSIVADLINRFFWLSYAGAAVIVWTGALMIFDDPLIEHKGWISNPVEYISAAVITLAVTAFAHWFHRVRESD